MKHAVLFVTLTFLATFVLVGWMNGGLGLGERQVLGAQSSFWSRMWEKMIRPRAIPTRGVRMGAPAGQPSAGQSPLDGVWAAPSVTPTGSVAVSDDPETDLTNLEQELRSLDQEMNAVKLDAGSN